MQQGSAWWLSKKELPKNFGVNKLDYKDDNVKKLIKIANIEKQFIENDENYKDDRTKIEPIFESGGLIIGKKDKIVCSPYLKTIKGNFKVPLLNVRKVENIYYIKDDLHSLTVRCHKIGQE